MFSQMIITVEEAATHTVTWVVEGQEDVTETYAEGLTPVYPNGTPTKAEDDTYTYTFKSWTPEVSAVTGDVTYTATFNADPKTRLSVNKTEFTLGEPILVTAFGDANDWIGVFTKDNVTSGSLRYYYLSGAANHATSGQPIDITLGSGNQPGGHTWQAGTYYIGLVEVNGGSTLVKSIQITVTAPTTTYTVTWKVEGQDDVTQTYEEGATPAYPNGTPEKAADEQYTYTFAGWSPEVVAVTGNATYTAQFTATPIVPETPVTTYTIQFVDEDGELIEEKQVAEGSVITAPATNPTKAADTQFTYAFHHWQGWTEGMTATEDMTFTATYTASVQLSNTTVSTGTTTYTTHPSLGVDYLQFRYDSNHTSNTAMVIDLGTVDLSQYATVIVNYDSGLFDGTKLGDENDFFALTNTADPITDASANVIATGRMTVSGLSCTASRRNAIIDLTNANGSETVYLAARLETWIGIYSITFVPVDSVGEETYTVRFVDEDGTELSRQTVRKGAAIVPPTTIPTKDADEQFTYSFYDWDGWTAGMTATEDMTFTARYAASVLWSNVTKISGSPVDATHPWTGHPYLQFRNYQPVLKLGTVDLSKYAQVIVNYGNGSGSGGSLGDANDFFALTNTADPVTDASTNVIATGRMTASSHSWTASSRDAFMDLTDVDDNGEVYFAFRLECSMDIHSITFIPN